MAITHFTPQIISRADGRSAVLSAAYRHCARMEYEAEARTVDYSAKRNLAHEDFVLPPDAPQWVRDLIADRSVAGAAEAFWNKVEAFEKRHDAQFAKEFIIALPVELSTAQNITLMQQFVVEQVLARGQVADWVYHDEPGNPHVHLMTTLRPLTETGFGGKKVAVVGPDGQPVRTKSGKIEYRLWAGEKTQFLEQRQGWLDLQNQHLALAGLDIRVDGRSYAERGIDLVATSHIGVAAKAIQRKADREGRAPELERLKLLEAQRQGNARRIQRRPEIVLDMIAKEKSVFDERDIARILHRYIDDAGTFRYLMAQILQRPDALRLERETVDFGTGELIRAKYTTRDLIRIEAEMVSRTGHLAKSSGYGVHENVLAGVFARHGQLSEEQRSAIEHVASQGGVAAVVGRAGAGKTTMMKAAREAWEAAGYHVVGAALAGKAAEGLEKEAGIASRTLSSWELRWKQGRDKLDDKTVLVLDEAGMVASRQMALFVEAVSRAGAKLVLVGDPEQLQPIEAGAAFRAIADRIGYAELETIYRQKQDWMRVASLHLARGHVAPALTTYAENGRVLGSDLKAQAISNLIEDWNRDYDPQKSMLILAHLRRDVRTLNDMARAKLVERGIIALGHGFATQEGERRFAPGDQIVFLKNDGGLGVKNGMIGKVVEAAPRRIVAEIGQGNHRHRVEIDQRFYRNLDHGYATTVHKSQGATVDRVKVLATLSLDRHLTYVAMTRHREDVALYYGRRSFDLNGGLIPTLSKRNAKETTLDYAGARFYRQALRFANSRGLNIVRVARTLLKDQMDWALRQKQRLSDIGKRLRGLGTRLGLVDVHQTANVQTAKEAAPMVAGITVFSQSLRDAVEEKLRVDPSVGKLWEEVSSRFRSVFADPETVFKAMDFDAVLKDPVVASETLDRLVREPASMGPLKGNVGLLAGKADREKRRIAELNVPAFRRDIERYLRVRNAALQKLEVEEKARRHRMSIDIPALSPAAHQVLEHVREAIARDDLPAALGLALADRTAKAEIDAFIKAGAQRFGERALLTNAAREPHGSAFEKAALGLNPAEREKLATAWSTLRAAQQLAAHERTTEALKQTEALRLSQRQGQVLK
ncbi:Ti-type conjugative transfer relaxase TraA [Mesorhizobium sp. CAU 1741]|uniref:Ti-type conjugative transfer relaxase TraA n=1 Tax=Mesorhizobium sp. CAU 1741 TaxID=3140366 RepID=UPI00325B38B0